MTIKEKLIKEIEQSPESFATQLLSFLNLLQSQTQITLPVTEINQNPFKFIDGFMVLKSQNPLPEIDWVSFVREERINALNKSTI
ncbi:hypothetical protein APA_4016 [Pseudanabaena sp. lw0831]|uniref:hypothetical protein n=1 Tax=Pseudanabaena sp. lw0831 TaxID=1357935 RepID=UPI00191640B0|nr:hypothetical protein [Pseudanabaena sp. lw0831]GBO55866.1 hypothetical protein APA_4016 [Pseudanabaena sp. lw0831]